ncbi:hypothetical protein GCM10022408_01420 [Hymenobacter fastidiosus]|uniref:DUF1795 domain-containing protein n=1 Tax=Hymenobacter fastidiosus TaxID=486264 RepID=A0ABP7RA49_9BACT
MKAFSLLLLFSAVASLAFGQSPAAPTRIDFCGQQYELPAGAVLESPYEVKGDKFDITLIYLNYNALSTAPAEFAKQRRKKMKGEPLQEITCFIQDSPAKAYKFGYRTEAGMAYELIAYGVTKGQPVLVQITTDIDPYQSTDIPAFARQFVHLAK